MLRKQQTSPLISTSEYIDAFNFADIEEQILIELDISNTEISSQLAIVRANTTRGVNRSHNLDDFDLKEAELIASPPPPSSSFKRRAPDTDAENSSPPASSPPIRPEKKKAATWTSRLVEQQTVHLDKIALAGDFERQLMDKWICRSKDCSNQDSYCYPDPQTPQVHYAISAAQQKSWASSISMGDCTLQQPPMKVWLFWQQDGPVTRESRVSGRKTFQQTTKSTLETLQEQLEQSRLQAQLLQEQNRFTQQQERDEDRQWRREEWDDERQAHQEEQEVERQRHKDLIECERQRKEQERELLQAYAPPLPPLPPLPPHLPILPSSLPFQHLYPHSTPLTHHRSLPIPISPQCQSQREQEQRKSSPLSLLQSDWALVRRFIDHKISGQPPHIADKWRRTGQIIEDNDWTVQDLKDMHDDSSAIYQCALKAGISDGFARRFAGDLRTFKQIVREEEAAATVLSAVGGGEGGFVR